MLQYVIKTGMHDYLLFYRPHRGVVIVSVETVCLYVCLYVCNTITFESFDLVCRLQVRFKYMKVSRVKVKVTGANSVSACPVRALNFKCLDLECSFLISRSMF